MTNRSQRIVYLTAGAGGMYCGSCLHDNTLVRALQALGVDALLVPVYTPIHTDEPDVSVNRVPFGGINVYLQQRFWLFRHLPAWTDRLLDRPGLIRWAASRGLKTDARVLGELTVSMLRGCRGRQKKEVGKLVSWLQRDVQPELINLSNILIAGCAEQLKDQLQIPLLVTLQGDDLFLEQLVEPFRSQALLEARKLVAQIDGFVVFSRYYADLMSDYLGIPQRKLHVVPLGLDVTEFAQMADNPAGGSAKAGQSEMDSTAVGLPHRIGYLARLAPEKGLHVLADAFVRLRQMPGMQATRLELAGWLGGEHREYAEGVFGLLSKAGLEDAYSYHGAVDRAGKLQLLADVDVVCVPTVHPEPKGLFVLEALAAGKPVVVPESGAFPELLERLGGGVLARPEDPQHLAESLCSLLGDRSRCLQLGQSGRTTLHQRYDAPSMARATLEVYRQFLDAP